MSAAEIRESDDSIEIESQNSKYGDGSTLSLEEGLAQAQPGAGNGSNDSFF